MSKVIITQTDRGISSELDLRKNKLYSHGLKDVITIFEIDDLGEVKASLSTARYYNVDSHHTFINNIKRERLDENPKGKGGFGLFNNYIKKTTFDKYLKFAKKNGSYKEYSSISEILNPEMILSLENQVGLIVDKIKETKDLLKSKKTINPCNSKGQYRKINYKNLLIVNHDVKQASLTDDLTFLTKTINNPLSITSSSIEENITYYGISGLLRSNSFNSASKNYCIYSLGKKGVKTFTQLNAQLEGLNSHLGLLTRETLNSMS